jgi:hypothetical protein
VLPLPIAPRAEHVGSKTAVQIRSHAQKYFLKVQKNDTGERVPPPRPKRRSSQPYPQKACVPGLPGAPPGAARAPAARRGPAVVVVCRPAFLHGALVVCAYR